MNQSINKIIGYTLATLLIVSLGAVVTLPVVLAWWDKNPYWLLLYLTYPIGLAAVAAVCGVTKIEKTNEEKRRNSNEYR